MKNIAVQYIFNKMPATMYKTISLIISSIIKYNLKYIFTTRTNFLLTCTDY